MGLFSRKTDEQIIAEGRELYIKGDLSGASLKLGKVARKGHPEACFLIAKIHLEIADKRDRELYTRSAKTYLENRLPKSTLVRVSKPPCLSSICRTLLF